MRRAGFSRQILGVSSPAAVQAGLSVGAISQAATLEQAAQQADLIYLAQPVDRLLCTLEALGSIVRTNCLITDAGSTKSAIVEKASACVPAGAFLGGHPLAGKEQRGADAADETLFRNRPYVLTPTGAMTPGMLEFQHWLRRMEARVVVMPAAEHDNVVALTSHLPQLLSTAISVTLAETGNSKVFELFGPGLIDMTRLSMSSPEIWKSVLDTNRAEIANALQAFGAVLANLATRVEAGLDVEDLFATARTFSLSLRER